MTELQSSQIRYEGVFDWPQLYSAMHGWFSERRYDFHETKHVKKPGTYGHELEFEVKAEREETDYIRYIIEVSIKAYHVEDVEIITEGKKQQKTKTGMLIISLKPVLELDWNKRWNTKFEKKAHEFFTKYIIKKQIEQWKENLQYETYKLQTKIKEELKLEHN